ncbi:signal transducer CD24 [Neopsephotus bourkii]|uniref:signal transducer CD24 n=1 Tax=Neopsephotus bourkii TaxID=309878 RepID=UPI002AA5A956|nr:signal transducer CD24 [Neopsephotus bourkii]
MGTALAVRLGLGLLLMALLLPTQIYCDANGTNGTSPTPNNSSSSTYLSSVTNSLNNTTTQGHGNSLHSTTSLLFILSVSVLYFCC